ncbi:MAG: hypothetical protein ABIR32_05570 [Ilumatobacteraceae bacterium]
MTIAIHNPDGEPARPVVAAATVERMPGLAIAAAASLGAGVIHAGAIGLHADNQTLARVFIATAVFQLGWGLIVLLHPARWLAVIGAVGNLALVGGWLLTRVSGIAFISGLETREPAQFADTACALLGVTAVGLAFSAAVIGSRATRPLSLSITGLVIAAITIPAMLASANHVHDHGAEGAAHSHGTATVAAATGAAGVIDESLPHSHDDGAAVAVDDASVTPTTVATAITAITVIDESVPHDHGTAAATDPATATVSADGTTETTVHNHAAAEQAVAPVPYDPTKPIDLGGVPGVTPEEQARAENLVAITLIRLPQWSDPAVAEAAGFHSIGDGVTGHEHYVQWDWINDDVWLNPDFPESLVYEPQPDGTKKLVSAMYMIPDTMTLDQVPDIGGSLTQWHIHDNLCYTPDPVAPKVAGTTSPDGTCRAGLVKGKEAPMIHVWIESTPCGPFAALEGVGAGQIQDGEVRLCDHVHGG